MGFEKNVFINCPFDEDFLPLLRAAVFTLLACGFTPRLALEEQDSGRPRLDKIRELIQQSCWSLHDLSRLEDPSPRYNMPFELGLDLGCRLYGSGELSRKRCLILEKERYRYQKALSDISGNDIAAHHNHPDQLVRIVRNWLKSSTGRKLPGARLLWQSLNQFYSDFEAILTQEGEELDDVSIPDFIDYVQTWLNTVSPELPPR
ncbi:MAG TPA: hypothetical protein VKZ59_08585 [Acidobacteriota bacterium]|nr:hypothetical protein [Acidobacteriota bacterium]